MRSIFCFLTVVAVPFVSFANCAKDSELKAMSLRTLQSQMMVAALSCKQSAQYNDFIKKYQSDFTKGGKEIEAYFKRNYGASYKEHINKFITKIANDASRVSLNINESQYCNETAKLFDSLLEAKSDTIFEQAKVETQKISMNISSCSG